MSGAFTLSASLIPLHLPLKSSVQQILILLLCLLEFLFFFFPPKDGWQVESMSTYGRKYYDPKELLTANSPSGRGEASWAPPPFAIKCWQALSCIGGKQITTAAAHSWVK